MGPDGPQGGCTLRPRDTRCHRGGDRRLRPGRARLPRRAGAAHAGAAPARRLLAHGGAPGAGAGRARRDRRPRALRGPAGRPGGGPGGGGHPPPHPRGAGRPGSAGGEARGGRQDHVPLRGGGGADDRRRAAGGGGLLGVPEPALGFGLPDPAPGARLGHPGPAVRDRVRGDQLRAVAGLPQPHQRPPPGLAHLRRVRRGADAGLGGAPLRSGGADRRAGAPERLRGRAVPAGLGRGDGGDGLAALPARRRGRRGQSGGRRGCATGSRRDRSPPCPSRAGSCGAPKGPTSSTAATPRRRRCTGGRWGPG